MLIFNLLLGLILLIFVRGTSDVSNGRMHDVGDTILVLNSHPSNSGSSVLITDLNDFALSFLCETPSGCVILSEYTSLTMKEMWGLVFMVESCGTVANSKEWRKAHQEYKTSVQRMLDCYLRMCNDMRQVNSQLSPAQYPEEILKEREGLLMEQGRSRPGLKEGSFVPIHVGTQNQVDELVREHECALDDLNRMKARWQREAFDHRAKIKRLECELKLLGRSVQPSAAFARGLSPGLQAELKNFIASGKSVSGLRVEEVDNLQNMHADTVGMTLVELCNSLYDSGVTRETVLTELSAISARLAQVERLLGDPSVQAYHHAMSIERGELIQLLEETLASLPAIAVDQATPTRVTERMAHPSIPLQVTMPSDTQVPTQHASAISAPIIPVDLPEILQQKPGQGLQQPSATLELLSSAPATSTLLEWGAVQMRPFRHGFMKLTSFTSRYGSEYGIDFEEHVECVLKRFQDVNLRGGVPSNVDWKNSTQILLFQRIEGILEALTELADLIIEAKQTASKPDHVLDALERDYDGFKAAFDYSLELFAPIHHSMFSQATRMPLSLAPMTSSALSHSSAVSARAYPLQRQAGTPTQPSFPVASPIPPALRSHSPSLRRSSPSPYAALTGRFESSTGDSYVKRGSFQGLRQSRQASDRNQSVRACSWRRGQSSDSRGSFPSRRGPRGVSSFHSGFVGMTRRPPRRTAPFPAPFAEGSSDRFSSRFTSQVEV